MAGVQTTRRASETDPRTQRMLVDKELPCCCCEDTSLLIVGDQRDKRERYTENADEDVCVCWEREGGREFQNGVHDTLYGTSIYTIHYIVVSLKFSCNILFENNKNKNLHMLLHLTNTPPKPRDCCSVLLENRRVPHVGSYIAVRSQIYIY